MHDTRDDEMFVLTRGSPPLRCGRAIYFRRPEMTAQVGKNRFYKKVALAPPYERKTMSEIEAELHRAAAYWMSVAAKGSGGKTVALSKTDELLRAESSASRIPDSAAQPTLNEMEAPPLDVLGLHE